MAPIQESLPQAQFQTWFKPLKLIRADHKRVVLGVPNRFHEDWLRNNYSNELNTIRRHYGDSLQLEFEHVVEENIEASHSHLNLANSESKRSDASIDSSPTGSDPLRLQPNQPQPEAPPRLRIVDDRPSESAEFAHIDPPNLPKINDEFLELAYNRFAAQCAKMVVAGNSAINPLIIYGGVGMGKTHLLTYIGRQIYEQDPNLRIRYTNAESFTAEMVQSLQTNTNHVFKRKYREDTDVLLFDDVQGLTKRKRTQDELLHIFNELTSQGKRVVFTTRVSPGSLEVFSDPLKSRLVSGVIAEINEPTYEERVETLNRKAACEGIHIEMAAIRALAGRGQKDIRELVGSLIRLHVQAKLDNRVMDQEYMGEHHHWSTEPRAESISMEEIVSLVEHHFGIKRVDLLSKSRKNAVNWARQVAMYLARQYTLLSLEQIGKHFERDHATVIHAHQKVKDAIEKKANRRYEVDFLKKKIAARLGYEK